MKTTASFRSFCPEDGRVFIRFIEDIRALGRDRYWKTGLDGGFGFIAAIDLDFLAST